MTAEAPLEILKQGVENWNRWRTANKDIAIHPNLNGVNLHGVELDGANFEGTRLEAADLSEASLTNANFRGAILNRINLNKADLSWGNLYFAMIQSADLRGADLQFVNLSRADLRDANIDGSKMQWSVLGYLDLRTVRGLEGVRHVGPSTIGLDTIFASNGQIPQAFLRGAGVPETFMEYIGSLAHKPFEFYSCFISYSSQDQEFADRLYADLQASGVRCWFAREDLKIGDKFRQRIDEAIRFHDKLLVVLSKSSVNSSWVEDEVEAAFARERKENKAVLFPIRLDDTVMRTDKAWAATLQRMRHIGDFSFWHNQKSYEKVFQRLLRDLQESNH